MQVGKNMQDVQIKSIELILMALRRNAHGGNQLDNDAALYAIQAVLDKSKRETNKNKTALFNRLFSFMSSVVMYFLRQ